MFKCLILSLLLSASFLSASLYAQNSPVFSGQPAAASNPDKLNGILSAYRVYDLNSSGLKSYLQEEGGPEKSFSLDLPGLGTWPLTMSVRPLLPATYRLRVDNGQEIQELPGPGDIAWVGHATGNPARPASLTVSDQYIFGTVQTAEGDYFIEPLRDLDPAAPADRFIVYRTDAVLPDATHTCGVTEVFERKAKTQPAAGERQVGLCKNVDLAIASDYDMFVRYGSVSGVQTHNIGVMNEVANDYADAFDDGIYFLVVTQYVSTTTSSSLDVAITASTDAEVLLNNFRLWAGAGNFGITHDLGQLWVTRNICTASSGCGVIGLGYIGAVCGAFQYHLLEDYTGYNASGSGWQLRVLTSHEIGHNFSCNHDAVGSPTIMAPSVNNTADWSGQSVTEVGNFLPQITCLATCGANFSASSFTVTEGISANFLPAGAPSCAMGFTELLIPVAYSGSVGGGTVDVIVTGGTAEDNLDFDLPSTTLFFPPGGSNQTANLAVRIWNDQISEGTETIELELSGILAGSQNAVTITVVSDDVNPVTGYANFGQIGTGNAGGLNVPFRGANDDCRTQIILGASELSAAGFSANDIINALALEVTSKTSTQPYSGFTVKMKHTGSAPNSTGQPETTGFTTVYSANYTPSVGWNKFNFTSGFVWNGSSNLLVEFCFDNASASGNDLVRTSNGAATVFVAANGGSGCSLPVNSWSFFSNNRPNVRVYKGSDIAITLGDESNTNLEAGQTAYFKDDQNEFVLAVQHISGPNPACVNVAIDRAGTGRQSVPWLPGYFISDKTFFITSDDPTSTFSLTLYYWENEVSVWGGAVSTLKIITSSVPIASAGAANASINESVTYAAFGPASNSDQYRSYKANFTGLSGGFALTNAPALALPVEWLDFSGKPAGEDVELSWATANELNNRGYEVERSANGVAFGRIGFVAAQNGASTYRRYGFLDEKALTTKTPAWYYRLKQVDNDGSFSYSKIIRIQPPGQGFAWQLLPNPARHEVVLQRSECAGCAATVTVSDLAGREALRLRVTELANPIDLSALPAGIYLVTVRNDGGEVWQDKLLRW